LFWARPVPRVNPELVGVTLEGFTGSRGRALPPVAGWAAASGRLGLEPLILFLIMCLWQLPHSLSIARLYQSDYARAGISMLPLAGGRGNPVDKVILLDCLALIAAGALPEVHPSRPSGIERNLVVSLWDWGGPTDYMHDAAAADNDPEHRQGRAKLIPAERLKC